MRDATPRQNGLPVVLNDLINEIDKQIAFVLDEEAALGFIALLLVGVWLRVMFIKRRRESDPQQDA